MFCNGCSLFASRAAAATLGLAATGMSGCAWWRGEPPPAAPAVAPSSAGALLGEPQASALRARMREHAMAHCGSCHQSTLASHKAAAIAIYDLDRDDWYTMLTVPRLQAGFPRRLNARLDEAGRRDLAAFIAHEVALRQR
jgi:mono/diheme cytochrome c family protein